MTGKATAEPTSLKRPSSEIAMLVRLLLSVLMIMGAQALGAQVLYAGEAYVLGPDDEIIIRVLDLKEFPQEPVRIDSRGNISLPLIGHIQSAGKTIDQIESEVSLRLRRYLHEPQVTISIAEFRSRSVSVFGAVARPGVLQLRGPRTLWEVLSDAGGLKNEAGDTIKITRRIEHGELPLPGAHIDDTGRFSVAEIDVQSVIEMANPDQNIVLAENDVISVSRADIVYVMGHVYRAGGFVANGSISLLEVLALAGGFQPYAAPKKARILRIQEGNDQRQIIPVNLKRVLNGTMEDPTLKPQDILFVPHDSWKDFSVRMLTGAASAAASAAIYRESLR